jgi:hypothetical protein
MIIDPEHVEINAFFKIPCSNMNIELSNIFNIDAFTEMNYLVGSMQHISKIFFVVFIFEAFIEYSNGIDRLLIEILEKFILLIPCPSLDSSINLLSRYLKGIHSLFLIKVEVMILCWGFVQMGSY